MNSAPEVGLRWRAVPLALALALAGTAVVTCAAPPPNEEGVGMVRAPLKTNLAGPNNLLQFLPIPGGPSGNSTQETASTAANCSGNVPYAFVSHGNSDSRGPGFSRLKLTASCINDPTNANCFVDRTLTSLGAPNISSWGNDTAITRAGNNLIMIGNPYLTDTNPANVIFTTVTNPAAGTCGDQGLWTSKTLENCNAAQQKTGPTINGVQYGSNVDGSVLETDPYGAHDVYMVGGMGPSCAGGVNVQAVYRLGSQGTAAPVFVGYVPGAWDRVEALTTPDGGLALFGCDANTLRLRYGFPDATGKFVTTSTGNPCGTNPSSIFCDANNSLKSISTTGLPACSISTAFNGVNQITRQSSTMSRVSDGALSSEYNYFRLAYLANSGQIQTGYARLAKKGLAVASGVVSTGQAKLVDPTNAVFRLNFIDPDNEEQKISFLPQTAALYWYEGKLPGPTFNVGYSMVTGLSNYTAPRNANVNAGSPTPWIPNYPNGNFAGDFDRGAFYVEANPVMQGIANYRYFLPWTESKTGTANGWAHYNVVNATEHVFTGFAPVASSLTLNTDPGAAKLVTSGGVLQVHAISTDSSGTIKRAIYSDNTKTWSGWSSLGNGITFKPVAAVSWGAGRLDAVAVGTGGNMYQYAEQNGVIVTNWFDIGAPAGGFKEAPSITSTTSGQLFIVGVATGGAVYYKTWKNGWSSWTALQGGIIKGAPAAFSMSSNDVNVFGRGQNDHLWQYAAFNDGTANWEGKGTWYDLNSSFPGNLTASPAAAVRSSTSVDVFAGDGLHPFSNGPSDTTGHSQVMHSSYANGSWTSWHTIGAQLLGGGESSPYRTMAAVALSSSRVRVLVRGLDSKLWWSSNGT